MGGWIGQRNAKTIVYKSHVKRHNQRVGRYHEERSISQLKREEEESSNEQDYS